MLADLDDGRGHDGGLPKGGEPESNGGRGGGSKCQM